MEMLSSDPAAGAITAGGPATVDTSPASAETVPTLSASQPSSLLLIGSVDRDQLNRRLCTRTSDSCRARQSRCQIP